HYYASQTDVNGCESINRLDVTVTINNPAAPTGSGTQSFCFIDGKKVSDLSVTGDLGSSITWYNAATGGSVVPASTLLVDNTHYFASQTVGGCEGTARLDVLVNVSNPAAPTGSATQFFCSDASHTVADLTATGTTIQWYATSTGGSPLSGSTVLVNGNSYYASQIVAGCESASRLQVTVTINQAVSITTQPNPLQTKCSSFPVSFTVVASGDIGGYQWYKDGNPIAGATSATYSIASVAVSDAGIYTVHITGVGACAAGITSNNAQLIVNEDIIINTQPVASQNLCENSTATISVVASGTGLTYQWRKNGSVISDGGTISGTQTATLQITNLTAADAGNYDVIINSVSGACVQKFSNVSALTVKPLPVGTATVTPASQIICSNTAPSIALSSSLSGTTYSWTVVQSGVTGASNGSGNPIAQVLTATGTVAGTAAYTITPTANGCDGAVIPVTITVNPIASATATPASQPICSGSNISTIALTGTVSGTTFNWTRDNLAVTGIAASGTGDISGSLTNSTPNPIVVTFTITPTANSCAGTPTTATVTVNPTPLLSTTLTPAGICNNATFNYVPASATTGATFSWTRAAVAGISNAAVITPVAGSISEALNNTTSAPINVIYVYTISANGCTNSQNVVVSVNPTATVTAIANQLICSEDVFSTVTVSGPVSGATYNWSWTATGSVTTTLPTSGTGNIASTTIKNNTNIDVDLNFTVTPIINGCSGTPSTFKITVKAKPTISVSPVSQNVCYTTSSNITPISITNPNNVAGTTFSWTRDNPAGLSTTLPTNGTGNVPAVIMTNTGASTITVNFTLTATKNGCSSTTTASVTLYSQLQASVVTDNQTVCILANPAALNGTTATGGKGTYNYKWQSSTDGINFTDIAGAGTTGLTYQPPTTGLFTNNTYYRLKITDDCVTIFSNSVYIEVVSNVGFTFDLNSNLPNGNNPVCAGTIFTPDISSFHFANSAVRYTWSADPAYISPVTGGPVGTTSGVQLFIFRTSSANIGPLTTANNTNAPVTTTISITPSVYHYDNPPTLGSYICSVSPQFISVTINPTPTVNATSDKVVCSGDNVPATVFTGNVTASGISYSWTRTAGNIGLAPTSGTNSVPTFTATNATTAPITVTFTVTPNFTNGGTTCTGVSKTFTITVNPTPVLDAVSNQTVCNGSPTTAVNFNANTTPAGNNTFSWTNNTPSIGLAASGTGNIPSFSAINNGTTPVTATITVTPSYNSVTNCPGTAKQFTITVNPTPTATISAVASTVCYNTATSINFNGTANTTLIYTVNGGPNQTINLNASGTTSIATGNLTTATTYTLVSIAFQSAPGCSTNISGQSVTVNVNP
ncbi:MAG: hypothetical protein JSU03_03435, partial [Bacteroidetes bacterium]|nr:hypothetical protein [Bacteroidota bacterium]